VEQWPTAACGPEHAGREIAEAIGDEVGSSARQRRNREIRLPKKAQIADPKLWAGAAARADGDTHAILAARPVFDRTSF